MRDSKYHKEMIGKFPSIPCIPNPRLVGQGVLICFTVILISVDQKETASLKCNLRVIFFQPQKIVFILLLRRMIIMIVIFEVLYLHTRCTVQKQFKVDQLVYIVPEEKLKAQNCKERLDINEEISLQRPLHNRKRTVKQSQLQIT